MPSYSNIQQGRGRTCTVIALIHAYLYLTNQTNITDFDNDDIIRRYLKIFHSFGLRLTDLYEDTKPLRNIFDVIENFTSKKNFKIAIYPNDQAMLLRTIDGVVIKNFHSNSKKIDIYGNSLFEKGIPMIINLKSSGTTFQHREHCVFFDGEHIHTWGQYRTPKEFFEEKSLYTEYTTCMKIYMPSEVAYEKVYNSEILALSEYEELYKENKSQSFRPSLSAPKYSKYSFIQMRQNKLDSSIDESFNKASNNYNYLLANKKSTHSQYKYVNNSQIEVEEKRKEISRAKESLSREVSRAKEKLRIRDHHNREYKKEIEDETFSAQHIREMLDKVKSSGKQHRKLYRINK
ncbi:hypothetical protein [Francisella frigiditurris]|nr:hypothetical protein [Francisella frigiditurris]